MGTKLTQYKHNKHGRAIAAATEPKDTTTHNEKGKND